MQNRQNNGEMRCCAGLVNSFHCGKIYYIFSQLNFLLLISDIRSVNVIYFIFHFLPLLLHNLWNDAMKAILIRFAAEEIR